MLHFPDLVSYSPLVGIPSYSLELHSIITLVSRVSLLERGVITGVIVTCNIGYYRRLSTL